MLWLVSGLPGSAVAEVPTSGVDSLVEPSLHAIEAREDRAAHLLHWLKVLRDDKRAIFSAAAHAQRAVEYLHVLKSTQTQAA